MNRFYSILSVLLFVPILITAQSVKFSDYDGDDSRDINFEVIGKLNNRILVYKNIRSNHKINIYNSDMSTAETVRLDFVPIRTFNMDFVVYPDFFYMIYQYQQGRILHCMAVKMDANGKKMNEPVEVDTTQIPILASNKIYSTICSEDKKKIMIFKVQTRNQNFSLATKLFDNQLTLVDKYRHLNDYNERHDNYDNFLLGNDGTLVFTYDKQSGNRDNSNALELIIKEPLVDTLAYQNIDLDEKYIDEVKLKIDNLNRRYVINSFYYKRNRGNIEGLFTYIWDIDNHKTYASQFNFIDDSLRNEAKRDGMLRFAFDNFFIRNIVVRKDGGYILTAEDYTSDTWDINSPFNRYDYLYNRYGLRSGGYYDPYFGSYYRPYNRFNTQSTRYYYENILLLSISKTGKTEWGKIIQKDQFDDNEENFMSFSTMNSGGEIHLLFNNDKRYQVISDQSITPGGTIKRNPTLRSPKRGFEFMPKLSKQIGPGELIVPCAYRGYICFAKIDF